MNSEAPTPSTPRLAGAPIRGWQRFLGGGFSKGPDLELARPELARPELARPELARPELARPELARPELARPVQTRALQGGCATAVGSFPTAADVIRALGPVAAIFGVLVLEILGVLVRQGAAAG